MGINYSKLILKGTIIIAFFSIFTQGIGYLVRMYLSRVVSPSDFGLFYSVFSLVMFLTLFADLGYTSAIVKYISEFKAKDEFQKIKGSIISITLFLGLMSIFLTCLMFFLSDFLAINYFKDAGASFLLKICFSLFIFRVFRGILAAIFRGFGSMFFFALSGFFSKFFFLLLIILFVLLGVKNNAYLPGYAFTLAPLVTFLFLLPIAVYKSNFFKHKASFSFSLFKKLTCFAFPSLLNGVAGMVIGYIDVIILTAFVSLADVGVYNAVLPTALVLGRIGGSFSSVLMPTSSELHAKNELNKLRKGIKKLYNYLLFGIMPISLIIFTFSKTIINILFGAAYVSGALALKILTVGVIFLGLSKINNSILVGLGRPKDVFKITSMGAVINVILNLALIPFLGIEGAALTTAFSYLFLFTANSIKIAKVIESKVPWKDWMKIILNGFIFLVLIHLFKIFLPFNLYVNGLIGIVIAGLVYLLLGRCLKIFSFKEIINHVYFFKKRNND